jgi:hypothetical protein
MSDPGTYALAMLTALDPYDPRLKPISEDKQISISDHIKMPSWNVRLHGDPDEFEHDPSEGPQNTKTKSFGVVVAKSMVWKGSYNFYYQGKVS